MILSKNELRSSSGRIRYRVRVRAGIDYGVTAVSIMSCSCPTTVSYICRCSTIRVPHVPSIPRVVPFVSPCLTILLFAVLFGVTRRRVPNSSVAAFPGVQQILMSSRVTASARQVQHVAESVRRYQHCTTPNHRHRLSRFGQISNCMPGILCDGPYRRHRFPAGLAPEGPRAHTERSWSQYHMHDH
jgi:hypothetical protein